MIRIMSTPGPAVINFGEEFADTAVHLNISICIFAGNVNIATLERAFVVCPKFTEEGKSGRFFFSHFKFSKVCPDNSGRVDVKYFDEKFKGLEHKNKKKLNRPTKDRQPTKKVVQACVTFSPFHHGIG